MTEPMLDRVTVILPTCDRPDRLRRVLRYYRATGCRAPLMVLDSSREPDRAAREALDAIETPVSLTRFDPQTPPLAKIREGLRQAATPYAVLWADDDFLVPGALEEGVRILAREPGISAVHGTSALFRARDGALQWVAPYPQRAILNETGSARLLNHLGRYTVTFYSLQRTGTLREQFDRVVGLGLDWHTWGEIALGALAVIQGKAHLMSRLYMAREGHEAMGSALAQQARVDPFAFSRERDNREKFRNLLASELMRQDRLDAAEAREQVEDAFGAYLAHLRRMKSGARAALRGFGCRIRSRLPGQEAALSLEALRRPGSRYHRDFLPIHRAIMAGSGREEAAVLAVAG